MMAEQRCWGTVDKDVHNQKAPDSIPMQSSGVAVDLPNYGGLLR